MGASMTFTSILRMAMLLIGISILTGSATVADADQRTIDADSQYAFAQSRLDAGAFDEAIAEFHRFVYFFPADHRVPSALFQTGMAHFGAGRYQAAAAVFDRQTGGDADSPLVSDAFFMLSRCHARQGMIEQAMVDLYNLMAASTEKAVLDRARYELGWLHVEQGRWNAADQAFDGITPDNRNRFRVDDLKAALARSDSIAVKNPTTAGMLSIIPGAGQLYGNRYQDAMTAFLINAGLIWAAWEAFDNEQYALGSVIGFVEFGFYAGNIYGAVSGPHKYNRERISEFRESLYQQRQISFSLAPAPDGAALCLIVDF
jgi:tetratricopeptide (TPR) repeat protein